ncbi:class I SAM-dependent methyltransferase [Horticoccus sp. 23ND18S-11]|uniref:class I SAM-dependent methyltransferase n=1 Tax=Horticoccus sp. 23ND18S-11 TaxID=3391832 RepID=UPI0039C9D3EF
MNQSYDPKKPGHWEGLDNPGQSARYEAIRNHVKRHFAGSWPTLLDVGCGAAVLSHYTQGVCDYIGIEPNEEAALAARGSSLGATIYNQSAEAFESERRFEVIVFNEMLYYSSNPIELLQRYAQLLSPSGILIVSIFLRPERRSFRQLLRKLLKPNQPVSNLHCAEMVDRFFWSAKFVVRERIPNAGTSMLWIAKMDSAGDQR